jgi:hypothetical protein
VAAFEVVEGALDVVFVEEVGLDDVVALEEVVVEAGVVFVSVVVVVIPLTLLRVKLFV